MWGNERRGRTLKTILLILLNLIVIAGIVYGYRYVTDKQSIADQEQYAASLASASEKKEEKEASYTELQAQYDRDMDTVKKYLPGIVCWGDSLTLGSAGGISFPQELQKKIDQTINDKYDFRSTVEKPEDYSRADWNSYTVDIRVENMGAQEEDSWSVLGRSGAANLVLASDLKIPAECERVLIKFRSPTGRDVNPSVGSSFNTITVGGIEGTLSYGENSFNQAYGKTYYFTRLTPGEETVIEKGTEIISPQKDLYKDYVQVIWIGTYGYYNSAQDLIDQVKLQIARNPSQSERFIVLGNFARRLNYWTGFSFTDGMDELEAAMATEFGSKYINIRKYLLGDAATDAAALEGSKFALTDNDKAYISVGQVAPSMIIPSSKVELKANFYELIGDIVFDRMDQLGYFNEVKDELGITAREKAEKQAEALSQDSRPVYYY